MIQGGNPLGNGTGGSDETIKGEFAENKVENTLSHTRGAISMARSRDEEISDLSSSLILNFIINELASEFYNQGVYDSYKYINERCEDLLGIQL